MKDDTDVCTLEELESMFSRTSEEEAEHEKEVMEKIKYFDEHPDEIPDLWQSSFTVIT